MRTENIMKYKSLIYALTFFLSMFALSGVNFDKFMKRNKPIEARVIVFILAFAASYLVTNFIVDFIS
ncbi:MAG TPA: hypothetical protein DHU33_00290 [Firmicutes bacterium]|nr:hypothetical protein [Bacillota bacterium]